MTGLRKSPRTVGDWSIGLGIASPKSNPEAATQKQVLTIAAIFFFFIKRNLVMGLYRYWCWSSGVCLGLFLLRFLVFSFLFFLYWFPLGFWDSLAGPMRVCLLCRYQTDCAFCIPSSQRAAL
ncbi:hypothetical protein BKA56DRAFT_592456, partial [Ilyonectria sp. MPI-CAGE-AT-0026]